MVCKDVGTQTRWVAVKIIDPFWVLIILLHLKFRVPTSGPQFAVSGHVCNSAASCCDSESSSGGMARQNGNNLGATKISIAVLMLEVFPSRNKKRRRRAAPIG